jgi:hypothetical protein
MTILPLCRRDAETFFNNRPDIEKQLVPILLNPTEREQPLSDQLL